jgi:hypothetical protein
MRMSPLGPLSFRDPLYEVLSRWVFTDVRNPVFQVHRLSWRHRVFRYGEAGTGRAVIGKFFDPNDSDECRVRRIQDEYRNLLRLRFLGFNMAPYSVVNPLCREWRLGLAVAEDAVPGKDLDHYVREACRGRNDLSPVLGCLASFLYRLHSRTAGGDAGPATSHAASYFERIVRKLCRQTLLPAAGVADYLGLRDVWLARRDMAQEVATVHGDATPTNFLFPTDREVVAIDLERMRKADPVFDVGMVCGELKHAFLWRTGNRYGAEPFIRRFLDEYARHFPDPAEAFRRVTRRVPFYMALTELRIARNDWLDWAYRRRLVWEARECLVWGLRL